ncbi:MAG: AMP-binding protein [Bacteroidales bacterium]|nr:AMP-binding protein [Bacteroidales bacterium]
MSRRHPYRIRNIFIRFNPIRALRGDHYPQTLRDLFENSTERYARRRFSCYADGTQGYSYSSFRDTCDLQSQRLSRYGISAGDRVAILSQNMPNWTVAFFTATAFGRVAIPILPDSSPNEINNILRHSETKVLYVSQRLLPNVPQECLDALTLVIDIETFAIIRKDENAFQCDGWTKAPNADSLATIIYTSGTTGNAKGVMLSHRNLCQNIMASHKAQRCSRKDRFMSILPMAHTYEMAIGCLYPVYVGACVYYIRKAPTPSILMAAMKEVRPTIMCAVPLIIEKVYRKSVYPTIRHSPTLNWMRKKMPRLLHFLVGRRLYRSFGGKLRFFGIGGSKLDPEVETFLKKARFPYAIGYGLTECAPLVCNAMVGRTRVGSVGIPSYKVEVKLHDVDPKTGTGEIICRGDNVMLGYYKDPERTQGVIDDEGWFHTGDMATVDKDGNYYLHGRLGSTIIGPSGENIYPEEIELVINGMDGVEESLVTEQDGKLVAKVKFADNVLNWDLAGEKRFIATLDMKRKELMEKVNSIVGKNSRIADVQAMKEPFEKTATQKIRRFKYKEDSAKENLEKDKK